MREGDRRGPCDGFLEVFPVDARTRRQGRSANLPWCPAGSPFPATAAPVAVTERRIAAWLAGEPGDRRLVYAGPGERAIEIDRGAITGLRAAGTAIQWTDDGAPRSMELP